MPTPAELAAERLAWTMDSWKSIEVRVHQELTDHIRDSAKTIDVNYVETATGKRLYEVSIPDPESGILTRSANYSDGERCADVGWRGEQQTQVVIKVSFSTEARSAKTERGLLSYLYLEHKPLPEALRSAVHLGSRRHLDRECDSFLIQDVKWTYRPVDLVYLIDRQTGMPLEIRCYDSADLRDQEQPTWTWTATSFTEVEDGRFFPMTSASNASHSTSAGTWEPALSFRIKVESISFDRSYPDSMFWPTIEPGANVWDQITGEHRVEPGGEEIRVEPTSSTSTAPPFQATPPRVWADAVSGVGLWLGLAVLAVAGVLWWRRRGAGWA